VPRYFFNVDETLDQEGQEIATLAAAKCQAVTFAGRTICDIAGEFWDAGDFSLTVTNDDGLILFTLRCVGTEAPAIRGTAA
jgi:hypothetical protein